MKTDFKLSKSLDWTKISATNGLLEFDCPKCLHNNSINISIFNTKTHQDNNELQLTDQKFGYIDQGFVILANIIAFGITIAILFGFFGEFIDAYGQVTYLLGIPIMWTLGRIIIPLFSKTFPIWRLKCKDCGEWIILSYNGEEIHLARDTAAEKNAKQANDTPEQKQSRVKSFNDSVIWDLRNGDNKAKENAALSLITSKDPNAVEIILEQALKETPKPENKSFFANSVKNDLLMTLDKNIKRIKTPESVDAYINALSSGDEEIIKHAIPQLGYLGSEKAKEPLEKMLSEGSFEKPEIIKLLTETAIRRIKKKNKMPIN